MSEKDATLAVASVARDARAEIASADECHSMLGAAVGRKAAVGQHPRGWIVALARAVGASVGVDLGEVTPCTRPSPVEWCCSAKREQPKRFFTGPRLAHGAALRGPATGEQPPGGDSEDWGAALGRHLKRDAEGAPS